MPYPTIIQRSGTTVPSLSTGEGFVLTQDSGTNKAGYYVGLNNTATFIGPQTIPTYSAFSKTTSGLVNAPGSGTSNDAVLHADGSWSAVASSNSCDCGVTVNYESKTGDYTISGLSGVEGTEYYYIIKNTGGNQIKVTYPSFSGNASFNLPAGQVGEVSLLWFSSGGWVGRYAITTA